ncbi:MAG: OmpA family protein [Vicinamibacteria bacterium]|jgi:outer membrane protein OmpA-like peptidoglycan-associated protein|nr:OmpA family protein [Vicinamibacteria bacterium]MBP9945861.1 OmpA family protein [Vicinamibacteria bacterium]
MRREKLFKRSLMLAMVSGLTLAGTDRVQSQTTDRETIRRDEVKSWVIEIDGKEYSAHASTPAYDGSTGLFRLPSAYTLPKGRFAFSLFRDNMDRDPKDEDISIHGVNLAFGATSRLELAVSFGLQNRINSDALFQPGYVNDYPFVNTGWQTGGGDIKLGAKFKLLDDYGSDPVGLALRGYVKLPTADEEKGLGTGKRAMGVDLVMSKSLGKKADIHAAIGYQWNSDPDSPFPVDIGNAVKWGLGLNFPACSRFQVQAEVTGTKYKDASFDQTSPIDLVVGPVVFLGKGFFIRPAVSKNLKFDDRGLNSGGKSSMGMQFSMGYHPGTACCEIAIPPPPPPPPTPAPMANRAPTVSCDPESASIKAGEMVGLRANASDPDNDSLTYSWTTSAGRVVGSDASVQLDTAGINGPASLIATVRVTDGRGGTAESSCNLRVPAPAPTPQVMTCGATGFPHNRARLNNVDKACLDDVALRLREDPRSRVMIVGHADRAESRSDLLSRQRAEATKAYLVRERGVDESRVSVTAVGSSQAGVPAAMQGNRRVEVIFVPEGAVPPSEK